MFDALTYLRVMGIPYATRGPNCSPGWVNIRCPLCEDHSNHGGFKLRDGSYHCWRCGSHQIVEVIMALEKCSYVEACRRIDEYEVTYPLPVVERESRQPVQVVEFPRGTGPLRTMHKDYLRSRGFDPDYLAERYGILGTSIYGDYAYRLIIPIVLDNKIVSYQARDVTGKQKLRYKACRRDQEVVHHKHTLYNIDRVSGTAIVVEGVFDAWRIGDGAVATFGTSVTKEQVALLLQRTSRVYVLFDPEPQAQAKAKQLCSLLNCLGLRATRLVLKSSDPAQAGPEEIQQVRCLL